MRKFLLGLLCGLILAFVVAVILVFSAIRLADRTPSVADNSVLLLRLEGEFPERPAVEIPFPAFEGQSNLTVRDVWSLLKRAASRFQSQGGGDRSAPAQCRVGESTGTARVAGSLQEIRQAGVRAAPLTQRREYYVATAADKIFSSPEDLVDVKGLRIEAMYLGNTWTSWA
jgi:protease IV